MAEKQTEIPELKVDLGRGLWLERVRIGDLREAEVNAHVMPKAKFERLVENIKIRGHLESVPYCVQPNGEGPIRICSGHHRIRAAKAAGQEEIVVLVDRSNLTRGQITAKQLAHNALVGFDDGEVLKQLLESLEDVDDLLASGVDESLLPTPESFKTDLFTPHADFQWKTVVFSFLDHQLEEFKAFLESVDRKVELLGVAEERDFEPFIKAVSEFSRIEDIKSVGTAVAMLTQIAVNEAEKDEGERAEFEDETWVPFSQVLKTRRIPASAAAVIRAGIEKMVKDDHVGEKNQWQALEYWAADYLGASDNAEEK